MNQSIIKKMSGRELRAAAAFGDIELQVIELSYDPPPLKDESTGTYYGGGRAKLSCPLCGSDIDIDFELGAVENCEHLITEDAGDLLFARSK